MKPSILPPTQGGDVGLAGRGGERDTVVRGELPPLCHFVTSPPQGGRLQASDRLPIKLTFQKLENLDCETASFRANPLPAVGGKGQLSGRHPLISPLAGEMSAMPTEGGNAAITEGGRCFSPSHLWGGVGEGPLVMCRTGSFAPLPATPHLTHTPGHPPAPVHGRPSPPGPAASPLRKTSDTRRRTARTAAERPAQGHYRPRWRRSWRC